MNFTLLRVDAGEIPGRCFQPSLQPSQWRKILQVKQTDGLQKGRWWVFCTALCLLLAGSWLAQMSVVPVDGTPERVTPALGLRSGWMRAMASNGHPLRSVGVEILGERRIRANASTGLNTSQHQLVLYLLQHMLTLYIQPISKAVGQTYHAARYC